MKIKKFYILQIEDLSNKQYGQVLDSLDSLNLRGQYYDLDDMIQVEYLDEEYFEKISNFLKTL